MSPTTAATVAIGACVGFLSGLFGKGGAAISTPLLTLVGFPPIVAVASPLPATIPATLAAASAYNREELVDWRVVRWSVAVGVPATASGAFMTRWIEGGSLVVATEAIVVVLGLRFLLVPRDPQEVMETPCAVRTRLVAIAIGVGLVSGLLANSGGFLLAPLYVVVLRLPFKNALASSLVVAAALAVPGTIVHAALGHVDWKLASAFGAAAVPGSYLGGRVALRTNSVRLERLYGASLLLVGLTTLILNG